MKCSVENGAIPDRSDWGPASLALDEAERLLAEHEGANRLWIEKWRAFLHLDRMGFSASGLERLVSVKRQARAIGDWETARDCDFAWARASRSPELLQLLYFGTPHAAYRNRIERKLGHPESPSFEWAPEQADEFRDREGNCLIDSERGSDDHPLECGQVPQRLLLALVRDLYAPPGMVTLFSRVFPDRVFNPENSPDLIAQAMRRLRAYLANSGSGLRVLESRGRYRIVATRPARILLRERPIDDRLRSFVLQLGVLPEITPRSAAKALSIPYRTAQRWLAESTAAGLLKREGVGRTTRYLRSPR